MTTNLFWKLFKHSGILRAIRRGLQPTVADKDNTSKPLEPSATPWVLTLSSYLVQIELQARSSGAVTFGEDKTVNSRLLGHW